MHRWTLRLLCPICEAFSVLLDLFLLHELAMSGDLGLGITHLTSKYLAKSSPFDLVDCQALIDGFCVKDTYYTASKYIILQIQLSL